MLSEPTKETGNTAITGNRDKCAAYMTLNSGETEKELDISNVSGSHYIWMGRSGSSVVTDNGGYVTQALLTKDAS